MEEDLVPFNDQIFNCLICGECCHQRFVPLSENDINRITEELDREDFILYFPNIDRYVMDRRVWDSACYFLDDVECRIHEIRPLVCRLYPLALFQEPINPEDKEKSKIILKNGDESYLYIDKSCPGVGKGEKFDMDRIRDLCTKIKKEMDKTDAPGTIPLGFRS